MPLTVYKDECHESSHKVKAKHFVRPLVASSSIVNKPLLLHYFDTGLDT